MCLNERADSWILGIDSSDLRRLEPITRSIIRVIRTSQDWVLMHQTECIVRAANLQIKNRKNISSQHAFFFATITTGNFIHCHTEVSLYMKIGSIKLENREYEKNITTLTDQEKNNH